MTDLLLWVQNQIHHHVLCFVYVSNLLNRIPESVSIQSVESVENVSIQNNKIHESIIFWSFYQETLVTKEGVSSFRHEYLLFWKFTLNVSHPC